MSHAWPLFLLCCLAGSRWLLEGAYPRTGESQTAFVLGCALAATYWVALETTRRVQSSSSRSGSVTFAQGVGVMFVITGPVLGQALAGHRLGSNNTTLALALTPVVLAVVGQAFGAGSHQDLPHLLWPPLAGLGGLLLLLPEPAYSDWQSWAGLAAVPLFCGVGGVWVASLPEKSSRASTMSRSPWSCAAGCALASCVSAALAGGAMVRPSAWHDALAGGSADAILLILSLHALNLLGYARWGTQFYLIPLVAIGEGILLLRPPLDGRFWIGLAMLVAACVGQFSPSLREGEKLLS